MRTHRPRQNADQWARIIDQFNGSGMTVNAFCEQHNIAKATFSKWQRKFRAPPEPISAELATVPAFKPIQTIKKKVDEESVSSASVVTLKLGADMILTIHSGVALS